MNDLFTSIADRPLALAMRRDLVVHLAVGAASSDHAGDACEHGSHDRSSTNFATMDVARAQFAVSAWSWVRPLRVIA